MVTWDHHSACSQQEAIAARPHTFFACAPVAGPSAKTVTTPHTHFCGCAPCSATTSQESCCINFSPCRSQTMTSTASSQPGCHCFCWALPVCCAGGVPTGRKPRSWGRSPCIPLLETMTVLHSVAQCMQTVASHILSRFTVVFGWRTTLVINYCLMTRGSSALFFLIAA